MRVEGVGGGREGGRGLTVGPQARGASGIVLAWAGHRFEVVLLEWHGNRYQSVTFSAGAAKRLYQTPARASARMASWEGLGRAIEKGTALASAA